MGNQLAQPGRRFTSTGAADWQVKLDGTRPYGSLRDAQMTEPANMVLVSPRTEVDFGFSCIFDPQPDITAYELAQLIPFFHGAIMNEAAWKQLGSATRHMKRN